MKEKRIKTLILLITIIFIIFSSLSFIIVKTHNDKLRKRVNKEIVLLLDNNISEEDKIEIINSEKLFNKYGIDIEKDYISNIEKDMNNKYLILLSINALLALIMVIILITIYNKKNNKDLEDITNIIKNINNKIYTLDIKTGDEEEISLLKSEIYKTMLMLKTDAEESKNKKTSVLDSVADISHQLKTPLTSISIILDNILESDSLTKEDIKKMLFSIQRQILDMNNLIVMLLRLSKFDANVVDFNKDKINVYDLLIGIKNKLDVNLDIKNISLEINSDKNIFFTGDAKWESEAIMNIVKNAVDHSYDNSKIIINVYKNEFYIRICVINNGEEIDKKDMKHIFERFYKSKNSKGFGIGLNLSKTIIEKDNGYIKVKSNKKETTFEIKYMLK